MSWTHCRGLGSKSSPKTWPGRCRQGTPWLEVGIDSKRFLEHTGPLGLLKASYRDRLIAETHSTFSVWMIAAQSKSTPAQDMGLRSMAIVMSKLAPFMASSAQQIDYNIELRQKFFRFSPLAQDHLLSLHICEECIEPQQSGMVRITLVRFAAVWMAACPQEIFGQEEPLPFLDDEDESEILQIERRLKDFVALHTTSFHGFAMHQQPWDPRRGLGVWASFRLQDPPSYLWTPPQA